MSHQPSLFDWGIVPTAAKSKKPSQSKLIAEWLLCGCSITPLQALEQFGCFRLAARIHELRCSGMSIIEEDVVEDGKRYARYFIGAMA